MKNNTNNYNITIVMYYTILKFTTKNIIVELFYIRIHLNNIQIYIIHYDKYL